MSYGIYKVTLPIPIKSKPRGGLGKYGNMTHSANDYRQWQELAFEALQKSGFKIPQKWNRICFKFYIKPRRGHKFDGGNIQGAVEDVFVQGHYLKDDNVDYIPRYMGDAVVSDKDCIEVFFCETKQDSLYVHEHFLD